MVYVHLVNGVIYYIVSYYHIAVVSNMTYLRVYAEALPIIALCQVPLVPHFAKAITATLQH